MKDIPKAKKVAELTVILLWVWLFTAAFSISQKILNINLVPQNLELIAKALLANFTLIVILMLIISLYLHIVDIHSVLESKFPNDGSLQDANDKQKFPPTI